MTATPRRATESTRIEHLEGGNYRVWGDLTIKDVTREIEVNACVEAAAEDPWGNERVGVAVRGTINRTDFGLTWNQTLETGRMLVGEEVNVLIDISAIRPERSYRSTALVCAAGALGCTDVPATSGREGGEVADSW